MMLVLRLGWLEVGQGRFMLMVMLTSVSLFWEIQFNSLQQLSFTVLLHPSIWVSTLVSIICGTITSIKRYILASWASSL